MDMAYQVVESLRAQHMYAHYYPGYGLVCYSNQTREIIHLAKSGTVTSASNES